MSLGKLVRKMRKQDEQRQREHEKNIEETGTIHLDMDVSLTMQKLFLTGIIVLAFLLGAVAGMIFLTAFYDNYILPNVISECQSSCYDISGRGSASNPLLPNLNQ